MFLLLYLRIFRYATQKDSITGDKKKPCLCSRVCHEAVQEESSNNAEKLHNKAACVSGKDEREDKDGNRAGRPTELLNRMSCRWKTFLVLTKVLRSNKMEGTGDERYRHCLAGIKAVTFNESHAKCLR